MIKSLTSILILVASFVFIAFAIFFAWAGLDAFKGPGQMWIAGIFLSISSIILVGFLVFAWMSYFKKQYQKVFSILGLSFFIALFLAFGTVFMFSFATK